MLKKMICDPRIMTRTVVHTDDEGNVIGKSVPGLFGDTIIHYDAQGNIIGKSVPGLFGGVLVHFWHCPSRL